MLASLFIAAALQATNPTIEVEEDPITGRISAFAAVSIPEGRLEIGCDKNRFRGLRVLVHTRVALPTEDLIAGARFFWYRFDSDQPRRGRWATDGLTARLRSQAAVAAFVQRAMTAERLIVRVVDVEDREIDLGFPLAGFEGAARQMLLACG